MGDAILYFIIKWVQFIPEYALYMCSQYKLILYDVVVDRIQFICNQKRKLTTIAESKMKKENKNHWLAYIFTRAGTYFLKNI